MITRKPFFKAILVLPLAAVACLSTAIPSLDYITGKALFEKQWVFAPSSTGASDGLGPYFNARACSTCHSGGGRGSLPHRAVHIDDPVYGQQLQQFTRPGVPAEAQFTLASVTTADGLTRPQVVVTSWQYGEPEAAKLSVRLPPSLAGLGLLAAIPDDQILVLADPNDANGDGISGRASRLANDRLGRFGWKASQPGLPEQVGRALSLDLGLGNPGYPSAAGDCTPAQAVCLAAAGQAETLEAPAEVIRLLLSYVSAISPLPVENIATPQVRRGARLFADIGCQQCHGGLTVAGDLQPYTDLLLHDMGPGLADDLAEGDAAGSEWRTAPLWGLGRRPANSGLLHDGRAATLEEAIDWHAGEAAAARQAYRELNETGQRDVIALLNGL